MDFSLSTYMLSVVAQWKRAWFFTVIGRNCVKTMKSVILAGVLPYLHQSHEKNAGITPSNKYTAGTFLHSYFMEMSPVDDLLHL